MEKVGKKTFLLGIQRDVRHFFGAILGPVRPSVPCCSSISGRQHRQLQDFLGFIV